MNTVIVSRIRPTLYRYSNLPWAWVRLDELAQLDVFEGWTPKQIWRRFFALSKDLDILAVASSDGDFANVGYEGELAYSLRDDEFEYFLGTQAVFNDYLERGDLFVPAGWANDVIEARKWRFVGTREVPHEHLDDRDECPPHTLNCVFNGHGFTAVIGVWEE